MMDTGRAWEEGPVLRCGALDRARLSGSLQRRDWRDEGASSHHDGSTRRQPRPLPRWEMTAQRCGKRRRAAPRMEQWGGEVGRCVGCGHDVQARRLRYMAMLALGHFLIRHGAGIGKALRIKPEMLPIEQGDATKMQPRNFKSKRDEDAGQTCRKSIQAQPEPIPEELARRASKSKFVLPSPAASLPAEQPAA